MPTHGDQPGTTKEAREAISVLHECPGWRDRRTRLVLGVIVALSAGFWASSRYPALDEKAAMGAGNTITTLGYSSLVKASSHSSTARRILSTTVNWIDTNKEGMVFGLSLAAGLATLLSLVGSQARPRGWLGGVPLGMILGAPLGLCVNCAAPIAHGLKAAGSRDDTALGAMISSPTLNVIVLSMLFSLFPMPIAAVRMAFVLLLLGVVVPLLTKVTRSNEQAVPASGVAEIPVHQGDSSCFSRQPDWRDAGLWVIRALSASFWNLARFAVPLMVFSGLLGATLTTLLPWERIATGLPSGFGSLFLVAIVGTALPVPMAFDVILAAALQAGGAPTEYVLILLCTLGAFSVFSFFVVWHSMSRHLAAATFLAVAGLGLASGLIGAELRERDERRKRRVVLEWFQSQPDAPHELASPRHGQQIDVVPSWRPQIPRGEPLALEGVPGVSVFRHSMITEAPASSFRFERMDARAIGIDEPWTYSIRQQIPPFTKFRGIAAGDVHNDGWVDLLLTSERGLAIYENLEGKGFARKPLSHPNVPEGWVLTATLVDLNNDGWLDIVATTYRNGNWFILNSGGDFASGEPQLLPNHPEAVATTAVSFGDIDLDGDLDIVLGNWSLGSRNRRGWSPRASRNVWLRNESSGFEVVELVGIPGETLTTLLTHLDDDPWLDLVVGNDFVPPDQIYRGSPNGWVQLTSADGTVPRTPYWTMSASSADVDNDLSPELYLAQTGQRIGDGTELSSVEVGTELCEELGPPLDQAQCRNALEVHRRLLQTRFSPNTLFECSNLPTGEFRRDCVGLHLLDLATSLSAGRPSDCELFPDSWELFRSVCRDVHRLPVATPTDAERTRSLPHLEEPSARATNVLLARGPTGVFVDRAAELGLEATG